MKTADKLGFTNGTLVACPLPREFESESDRIEQAIERALKEARYSFLNKEYHVEYFLHREL